MRYTQSVIVVLTEIQKLDLGISAKGLICRDRYVVLSTCIELFVFCVSYTKCYVSGKLYSNSIEDIRVDMESRDTGCRGNNYCIGKTIWPLSLAICSSICRWHYCIFLHSWGTFIILWNCSTPLSAVRRYTSPILMSFRLVWNQSTRALCFKARSYYYGGKSGSSPSP